MKRGKRGMVVFGVAEKKKKGKNVLKLSFSGRGKRGSV